MKKHTSYEAYGKDMEQYEERSASKEKSGQRGRESHMERVHREAKRRKRKKLLRIFLMLALVIAAFLGFNLAKSWIKGENWTVAVFGVDARDGNLEKGTRSDVIMIVNVNQNSGDVKLLSVFRDTYLKIGDDSYNKINAAYERGGHEQAIKALEENLDLKIDDYVTFGWGSVAKAINVLGGIDIELSEAEFSYINGFITETVNATGVGSVHLTHAGMNHLDGVQAVAYGRLRLMDTDFNRTARQRKVISLALEKAKAADPKTLIEVATNLLPEVSTSIGVGDIASVINTLGKYNIAEGASSGFPFSREMKNIGKLDCVVPTTLESNVMTAHQFLFGEEDYKPSAALKKISKQIAADSGLTEAGENAPEAKTGGGIVKKENEAAPEAEESPVPSPTEGTDMTEETASGEMLEIEETPGEGALDAGETEEDGEASENGEASDEAREENEAADPSGSEGAGGSGEPLPGSGNLSSDTALGDSPLGGNRQEDSGSDAAVGDIAEGVEAPTAGAEETGKQHAAPGVTKEETEESAVQESSAPQGETEAAGKDGEIGPGV